jgi:predicted dehydrogenase
MTPMGVAIIGASMRSTSFFSYLRDHPELGFVATAYDVIPGRCECLIEAFGTGETKVCNSLLEAIDDPRVDAVFVTTHDAAHAEPAVAALNAGKHVFCEKPLATSLEACDAIIEAAGNAPGIFYLGMNLRHGPVHEKLHEIRFSGRLGKLLTIETNEYYYGGRTYFRRWNRLREFGGGLWITKTCHDFDLLNWISGGNAVRIFGLSSLSHYRSKPGAAAYCRICDLKTQCPDYYEVSDEKGTGAQAALWLTEQHTGQKRDVCLYNSDKDTFDNAMALVEFDNDVRATHTCNVVSARETRQMRLMGTEGAAEGDMDEGTVTVWKRHTKEKETFDLRERMTSGHGGADDSIMQDFFHCCHTGAKPRSSWEDGRRSVAMGLAARESCDTGEVVTL